MIENHQIVKYLIGTSNLTIPIDDSSYIINKIASQELFPVNVWTSEPVDTEAVNVKTGYNREAEGHPAQRKTSILCSGTLTELQMLDTLKTARKWYVWEVYEDNSIGGIEVKGSLGIFAESLMGFSCNFVSVGNITNGTADMPTLRRLQINYSSLSEYNNTTIVEPEYSVLGISPLIKVIINGGEPDFVGVKVYLDSGFQLSDVEKQLYISGLSNDFKYSDETLATGIVEVNVGEYTGFDLDKSGITLVSPINQTDSIRYSSNNSITFEGDYLNYTLNFNI